MSHLSSVVSAAVSGSPESEKTFVLTLVVGAAAMLLLEMRRAHTCHGHAAIRGTYQPEE